jgi:hypothetical protein
LTSSPLYGIMVNMKATHTQECVACEQVIALPAPDPSIEYCLACTKEINAWHDSNKPSAWELEDWASQYDDDPNPYHGDYSEE